MDTKILVIAILGLVGFFVYQKCSEENVPNYDNIKQVEQEKKRQRFEEKEAIKASAEKEATQKKALEARGKRPDAQTAVFANDHFKAVFSTKGGTLTSLTLKDPQYQEAPRDWKTGLRDEESKKLAPVDLVTTNTKNYERFNPLRFEVYEGLDSLLPETDFVLEEKSADKVVFSYTQPDLPVKIVKKYELDKGGAPYQIWLTIQVSNISDKKVVFRGGVSQHGYQHQSEAAGGMFSKQPNLLQGICRHGDETFAVAWNDDDLAHPFSSVDQIGFVGVETNYFLSAMIPAAGTPASCHVASVVYSGRSDKEKWGRIVSELRFAETSLDPGASEIFRVKNYLGPKRYRKLQTVGNHLETSVNFGWLWPICQFLLSLLFFFQSFVGNWGVAIILLTVVVKVTLMPLTHKSFQSAERMKALKPEIDKLNEQFKDDPQAKQRETMAMYKRNKVNPLGGCIPSLLQMPIWFALFRTLRASPELYRAPFFGWITDLSNPDPYFVTPVLMGVSMFLQQRFTPMTGDQAQAKMMLYFMPVMFTAMMLFLPSGLTLYIFVNTVLSIAHQLWIHKRSQHTTDTRQGGGGRRGRHSDKD